MRRRLYNRMSILTLDVIAEVEMRPAIWMAGTPGFTNRAQKTESWLSVVRTLVEGYDQMDVAVQSEILKDVQSRWKSAKDYFLKGVKKWERSGSLPDEFNKIPYHTELHFLMPTRCLRPINGTYGGSSRGHRVVATWGNEEMVSGPYSYVKEEEIEQIVVPVSSPTPNAPYSPPAAATSSVSSPESDFAPHLRPSSPTRPPPAQRRRRSLRLTDRKLEVESRAQSLVQRVDGNDDSAHFGYEMGSLCRQMPLIRRQHFKAYCQVVAAAFVSTDPLPPIEDMIMHFQTVSGQRPPAPPANPNNMATQTDPPAPPPILPQQIYP